jgi:CRP-like cAMP-binding protein
VNGYRYIRAVRHPSATKLGYVLEHRLVMEQAIGRGLRAEEVVHHVNGDKADNRIENLRLYADGGEHTRHAHPDAGSAGREKAAKTTRGSANVNAKLGEDAVRQIRSLRAIGFTHDEIASNFGVSSSAVSDVLRGRTWKHVL